MELYAVKVSTNFLTWLLRFLNMYTMAIFCFCFCIITLKRHPNELWVNVSLIKVMDYVQLVSQPDTGFMIRRIKTNELKMSLTFIGPWESQSLCDRRLSCFQQYKEDWNKNSTDLGYLHLLMNALYVWVPLSVSVFKGLAMKSVDGITYSYKPWSRHLSRMLFFQIMLSVKGIYSCACIR